MTISSAVRVAGPYTGNGTTTSFPFAFKVFTTADVKVIRTNLSAIESTLVLGTDYTVTLNSNQNVSPGGTVVMLTAPASGFLLTLTSQVSNLQSTDLTNEGGFYPSVITNALDKLTILVQQLAVQVGLSVRTDISSSVTPAQLISTLNTNAANAVASASSASASATAAAASATTASNGAAVITTNLTAINTVNSNAAAINTNATNIANINTNATNIASINAVSSNSTNINAVNANSANINAVNANSTNINTAVANLPALSGKVSQTSATGSAAIPTGTTAQRDGSPLTGYQRFNTTTGKAEIYNGSIWTSVGGGATGGGADAIFQENGTTLTTSYTLTTGKNASMVGPLVVPTGLSVTVPSGQRLVIL